MYQDQPQEIVVITSKDGIWREEKIPLLGLGLMSLAAKFVGDVDPDIERGWSPFQWKRMYKEKMSPGYQEAMRELRTVDDNISNFSNELNYLVDLLPKDPTKLPDIALIIIEIKQRLDSIVEAGKELKPAKDKKLTDFYGRFHIKIPENLRKASGEYDGKIAEAGLISDFVEWVGRKIYEMTDADTREMKRVVQHLLNTTRQTIDSINRTLVEMTSYRKTGDIDKYIEAIQFVANEQKEFKKEFDAVYDSYLREPYEHALALEQKAKEDAAAKGEKYEPAHEEVSIDDRGDLEVVEVEDAPPEEEAPLEYAEEAEEISEPSMVPEEVRQKVLQEGMSWMEAIEEYNKEFPKKEEIAETEMAPISEEPESLTPPTRQVSEEDARRTLVQDPRIKALQPIPIPQFKEKAPEEGIPKTVRQEPYIPPSAPPTAKEPPPFTPRETMEMTPAETPKGHPMRFTEIGGEAPESSEAETMGWARSTLPSAGIQPQASIDSLLTKVSHKRFLDKLGDIAETENKYIIAAFIAKYSEELEEQNPQMATELLRAALDIADD